MRSNFAIHIFLFIFVITATACAGLSQGDKVSVESNPADNSGAFASESVNAPSQLSEGESSTTEEESQNMESLGYIQGEVETVEEKPSVAPALVPSVGSSDSSGTSGNEDLLPEGWPEYVPIMEGFQVNITSRNNETMNVVAFGKVPLDEVREFYLNLPEWELVEEPEVIDSTPDDNTDNGEEAYIFNRGTEKLMIKLWEDNENDRTIINLIYENQATGE
jgi:hypothetical protein